MTFDGEFVEIVYIYQISQQKLPLLYRLGWARYYYSSNFTVITVTYFSASSSKTQQVFVYEIISNLTQPNTT